MLSERQFIAAALGQQPAETPRRPAATTASTAGYSSRTRISSRFSRLNDLVILARPELPGEENLQGAARVDLKRRLLTLAHLPPTDGLHICKLRGDQQPKIQLSEWWQAANLWYRIWLLSDTDLYFALDRLRFDTDEDEKEAAKTGGSATPAAFIAALSSEFAPVSPPTASDIRWISAASTLHNERKALSILKAELEDRLYLCEFLIDRLVSDKVNDGLPERILLRDRVFFTGNSLRKSFLSSLDGNAATAVVSQLAEISRQLRELLALTTRALEDFYLRYGANRRSSADRDLDPAADGVEIEGMLEAAAEMGGELTGVTIRDLHQFGKALVARHDLLPGTEIMSLPETYTVSLYTGLLRSFGEAAPVETSEAVKLPEVLGSDTSLIPSFGYVLALLAGGSFYDQAAARPPPVSSPMITQHPRLAAILEAHSWPNPLIQEQFMIVLLLLWERQRGSCSPLYPWMSRLPGYRDGETVDDWATNLLMTDLRVAEYLEVPCTSDGVEHTREITLRFHRWIRDLLIDLAPHLFPAEAFDAATGPFSADRFLWATWIVESREFELEVSPCLAFLPHFPSEILQAAASAETEAGQAIRCIIEDTFCDTLAWRAAAVDESQAAPLSTLITTMADTMIGEDSTPPLPLIPGLNFVASADSERDFAHQRRRVLLPVMVGWQQRRGQKGPDVLKEVNAPLERITKLMVFDLPRRIGLLIPLMDYLNHHPAAQCLHPALGLRERLTVPTSLDSNGSRESVADRVAAKSQAETRQVFGISRTMWEELVAGDSAIASRRFRVFCEGPVSAGSQVFISYGLHESWSLLRNYGFCPRPKSPLQDPYRYDVINVALEPPDADSSADQELKTAILTFYKVPIEHLLHRLVFVEEEEDPQAKLGASFQEDLLKSVTESEVYRLTFGDLYGDGGLRMAMACLRVCLHPDIQSMMTDAETLLGPRTLEVTDIAHENYCIATLLGVVGDLLQGCDAKAAELRAWGFEGRPSWLSEGWRQRLLAYFEQHRVLLHSNYQALNQAARALQKQEARQCH